MKENQNIKNISFQQRLKSLRVSRNESQEDLAEKLNLTRQAIGNYELGKTEPNIEMLKKIARHYNVSLDYLMAMN